MAKKRYGAARAAATALFGLRLLVAAPAALAITPDQVETFSSGAGAWGSGRPDLDTAVLIPSGGPAGAGDAFLFVRSTGVNDPGSRLAVQSNDDPSWQGSYARISAIGESTVNDGGR